LSLPAKPRGGDIHSNRIFAILTKEVPDGKRGKAGSGRSEKAA